MKNCPHVPLYCHRRWMAVAALAGLALLMSCRTASYAHNDASSEASLAQLEKKFFQRSYLNDNTEERLARLEQFVFGLVVLNPDEDRLARLVSVIPDLKLEAAARHETRQSYACLQPAAAFETNESCWSKVLTWPESSRYPAVVAIEERLFGQDYAAEPIGKRLERLELKVFGKVSAVNDLCARVDRLKDQTGINIAMVQPPGTIWAGHFDDAPYIKAGNAKGSAWQRSLNRFLGSAF